MWHNLADQLWKMGFAGGIIAWITSMLADSSLDPLSGGSGWVGAGLLGMVLAWLCLKHLPAKDDQLKIKDDQLERILNLKDKQIADARDAFINSVERVTDASQANLEKVTIHCQAELSAITLTLKHELDRLFALHEKLVLYLEEKGDVDVGP